MASSCHRLRGEAFSSRPVGKQKREGLSAVGPHPTVSKSQALISISHLFSCYCLSCAHVSRDVVGYGLGLIPAAFGGEGLVTT